MAKPMVEYYRDKRTNLPYTLDPRTGFYYNPKSRLFYNPGTGRFFRAGGAQRLNPRTGQRFGAQERPFVQERPMQTPPIRKPGIFAAFAESARPLFGTNSSLPNQRARGRIRNPVQGALKFGRKRAMYGVLLGTRRR